LSIVVEDAAVICVDCSALPVARTPRSLKHLGYHCDTVCGIVAGDITYVASEPDQMYMEGKPEVWRQSPKPSSRPSRHASRTVHFGEWFVQALCAPLKRILQNGTAKKIIVLFYDQDGSRGSVAMSHLFERSLPDGYQRTSEHLSGQRWKFGFADCSWNCSECCSPTAEQRRAAAEQEASAVMMDNCFALL
jgi:hypothetical protein